MTENTCENIIPKEHRQGIPWSRILVGGLKLTVVLLILGGGLVATTIFFWWGIDALDAAAARSMSLPAIIPLTARPYWRLSTIILTIGLFIRMVLAFGSAVALEASLRTSRRKDQ